MSTVELLKQVRELKELETMAGELAAEIEAAKDALKQELDQRGTTEMTVDVYKIRYTTVQGRRLDTQALRKDIPAVYNQYTRHTVTRRFSVA